nr:molybdopterin synthase sulfur carrier subunit [Nothobranchius furzeri]
MTAQVTVLFFAKSAELAGLKEEELVAVPTPISSKDLWGLLLRKHPRLLVLEGQVVLAVRQQYVAICDQVLTPAEEHKTAQVTPLSGAKREEQAGQKKEETAASPTPISSKDRKGRLLRKHPRLLVLEGQVVLAVRQQYVAICDQVLTLADGDEVAVVPPLSGG